MLPTLSDVCVCVCVCVEQKNSNPPFAVVQVLNPLIRWGWNLKLFEPLKFRNLLILCVAMLANPYCKPAATEICARMGECPPQSSRYYAHTHTRTHSARVERWATEPPRPPCRVTHAYTDVRNKRDHHHHHPPTPAPARCGFSTESTESFSEHGFEPFLAREIPRASPALCIIRCQTERNPVRRINWRANTHTHTGQNKSDLAQSSGGDPVEFIACVHCVESPIFHCDEQASPASGILIISPGEHKSIRII